MGGSLYSKVFLPRKIDLEQEITISPAWSRMLHHCSQFTWGKLWDRWSGVSLVQCPRAPISRVLAFSPCLCRSLVISRYGLFCCFRSLACLITSLELPLTVSSSRMIFGPLTHTMSGQEDVDDRLGGIVAGRCSWAR